jgi:RHS repeat-associated protein
MLLNNRHGSVDSDAYRYGFQGQERDDEVKGEGNSYNYTFRMHDPRLGRFFAEDPLAPKYPWYTPYQVAGNSVIMSSELEGLEPEVENGILVGYTIQKGQGPTQIAQDVNNKETQLKYGYTLLEAKDWKDLVVENVAYYMNRGDWENPNMLEIDNPAWSRMNSNEGESITINHPDQAVVATTSKSLFAPYLIPANNATTLISLGLTSGTFLSNIDDYGKALNNGTFLANYKGSAKTWSRSYYGGGRGNVSSSFIKSAKLNTRVLGGVSNGFKIGGIGLSLFSLGSTEMMYRNGEIGNPVRVKSHLDNTAMLLFPPVAPGILVGNYLGEKYQPEIVEEITNPESTTVTITSFILESAGIPASQQSQSQNKKQDEK